MVNSYALRPAFTPLTIVLMVVGFFIFWPLGLAMLAYILWGERIPEVRRHFAGLRREWSSEFGGGCGARGFARSGNTAFDEYRARELKRLDEERRKIEEERKAFEAFMRNLREARDREEFDRFMRDRDTRGRSDDGKTIEL